VQAEIPTIPARRSVNAFVFMAFNLPDVGFYNPGAELAPHAAGREKRT
jgi:hypothetical protein